MSFKVALVMFKNSHYNYVTDINSLCSNADIINYFLGAELEMNDGTLQKVINVKLKYRVISGSFAGEIGFINPLIKPAFLPMLQTENGNLLAVTMNQLEQVI